MWAEQILKENNKHEQRSCSAVPQRTNRQCRPRRVGSKVVASGAIGGGSDTVNMFHRSAAYMTAVDRIDTARRYRKCTCATDGWKHGGEGHESHY